MTVCPLHLLSLCSQVTDTLQIFWSSVHFLSPSVSLTPKMLSLSLLQYIYFMLTTILLLRSDEIFLFDSYEA